MILDDLVKATQIRLKRHQEMISLTEMKRLAASQGRNINFQNQISTPGIHVIAEVKKASPSKGMIATDFPYLDIAESYEQAGADAISVLTEPDYFDGSITYLGAIAATVKTPLLRKDFTIDSYMIYEARANGANAILLIVAILSDEQLKSFRELAESLGMTAIVEAHDENEVVRAVRSGAKVIGINNRNLKDFTVDFDNSIRLRNLIPAGITTIAESGIKTPMDVERLDGAGFNAVLIGETLMRATNKAEMIQSLREVAQ
ncbi:indole-3-glycerol phosphate synthase TrpC [Lentilactobacillus sp. Marseille-Q4993]|uniref:indole-3-glycerol phosphate synthase TrpC n=1 Tax=Lentilactobacillus sp. Marseille-Q4993 TaxID=3039492 RepID=UPI0024BD1BAE|nr:indole-3-glycerol phosphate synthase TrpC [Lentilactobacillus sp. Marseille-Q4993]